MIRLHSETFPRTGGMTAAGFRRLLGRPELSMLQTVLREALQNVVDAAAGKAPTSVLVRLRTLDGVEAANLRNRLFAQMPANEDSCERLSKSLAKQSIRTLEICDFDTIGLCGPTRADRIGNGSEPINFINFMRNIGAVRDTHHGGGTYGYGKSSLYAMSRCSTIVVDSQTMDNGEPVRRLMACHLGNTFEDAGMRFTGRHWWGVPEDGSIEPCTGDAAAELALSFGLPLRNEARTGTSILIVDPELNDDIDIQHHCEQIVEVILWNFWPRMTRDVPTLRRLNVEVQCDGVPVTVPEPETYPPLDLYTQALTSIRQGKAGVKEIKHHSKRRSLGNLALSSGMRAPRLTNVRQADDDSPSPLPLRLSHHVALMRPVELVVRYLPGKPFVDERFEWAGVFVCSAEDEIESAFAQSEPPAHDDWMIANLPRGDAQKFVSMALRNINKEVESFITPTTSTPSRDGGGPSLAKVASLMGQLLDNPNGDSPGRWQGGLRGNTRKTKQSSTSHPVFMGLRSMPDGTAAACFHSKLSNNGKDSKLRLLAIPMLAIDGGTATLDVHDRHLMPKLISIGFEGDIPAQPKNGLLVGLREGTIEIFVTLVEDAAVKLTLSLESEAGQ